MKKQRIGMLSSVLVLGLLLAGCNTAGDSGLDKGDIAVEAPEAYPEEDAEGLGDNGEQGDPDAEDLDLEELDLEELGEDGGSGDGETIVELHPWSVDEVVVKPDSYGSDTQLITGIRHGVHDSYERIVVDLTGNGPIGWQTLWTTNPIEMGRGERLPVAGKEFLDINIFPVDIPGSDAEFDAAYANFDAHKGQSISWIYDGAFEGTGHLVIGMESKTPYRIFSLKDPLRLVVDLKN